MDSKVRKAIAETVKSVISDIHRKAPQWVTAKQVSLYGIMSDNGLNTGNAAPLVKILVSDMIIESKESNNSRIISYRIHQSIKGTDLTVVSKKVVDSIMTNPDMQPYIRHVARSLGEKPKVYNKVAKIPEPVMQVKSTVYIMFDNKISEGKIISTSVFNKDNREPPAFKDVDTLPISYDIVLKDKDLLVSRLGRDVYTDYNKLVRDLILEFKQ